VPLCEVSATEPQGTTYYWGQDLDGELDTLWGLEGYIHATGFFLGHPSSDIFKREMALVDRDRLLRNVQGLGSPDYDLHHYDFEGGRLTRPDDAAKDSKTSHVAVYHFWSSDEKWKELMRKLCALCEELKQSEASEKINVQACAVLKECMDPSLATLWVW
jgi:hypothetical protein